MKFILIVIFGIQVSAAVANINYSETELSHSLEALTNAIMTAIIDECDNLETREAYYNCVADSVNKVIKTSTLPAPPIPWEQSPPREPGPDDVPDKIYMEYPLVMEVMPDYSIGKKESDKEYPLVMVMPDYPPNDERGKPGPDDRPNDGPDGPVRKIPVTPTPGPQSEDNSL